MSATTEAVKERPILFKGPLIRAILEGRKAQTRRIVNPQPPAGADRHCWFNAPLYGWTAQPEPAADWHVVRCPYGVPGDRLWVRETWGLVRFYTDPDTGHVDSWDDWTGPIPRGCPPGRAVMYRADQDLDECKYDRGFGWRPSIHMPRWASRILIDVLEVRVERVRDITEADAIAEGSPLKSGSYHHATWFRGLWDEINGRRPGCSWADNPWVFVITFRRAEGGEA